MSRKKKRQVYLRTPRFEDVAFLLRLENDPEIWEVSQTTEMFSRQDIEAFVLENKHDLLQEQQQRFIIVLSNSDIAVGTLDLFQYDADEETAGVGISVLPEYRRRGLATAALYQLVDYAFKKIKLKKLYCSIFKDNIASIKLFRNCGFQSVDTLPLRFEVVKEKEELYFELEKSK